MSMLESLRHGINVWDPYLLVCIVLLVVCFTVPFHKKKKDQKTDPRPGKQCYRNVAGGILQNA